MDEWRRQGSGTKSKHTRMQHLTSGVSSAVDWDTTRTSAAVSANVATAQAITGHATTSAMWWAALQSQDHSTATHWRSALIAKEITSRSPAGT